MHELVSELAAAAGVEWKITCITPAPDGLLVAWELPGVTWRWVDGSLHYLYCMKLIDPAFVKVDPTLERVDGDELASEWHVEPLPVSLTELDWTRVISAGAFPFQQHTWRILIRCRHQPAELDIFGGSTPHVNPECRCSRGDDGLLVCHRHLYTAVNGRELRAGLWRRMDDASLSRDDQLPADVIRVIWRIFCSFPFLCPAYVTS